MAEDLLIDLPLIRQVNHSARKITSGAVKATVLGGKTLMQGATLLSDSINLLPGMGLKSSFFTFALLSLLLECRDELWGAWCRRQRARARALPRAGEAVALQKDISGASCLPAFLCEQFPGKSNLTLLH